MRRNCLILFSGVQSTPEFDSLQYILLCYYLIDFFFSTFDGCFTLISNLKKNAISEHTVCDKHYF